MSSGYIYVLINPTIQGLAKVGKTNRNPENRVAELSSATGVASPFILAFQQPVIDCDSAEVWVHEELTRKGYRHASNREFFNGPLHEIIPIVVQSANAVFESTAAPVESTGSSNDSQALAEELYELASQYAYGSENVLKNKTKALQLYEQAAALGHILACSQAAWLYEKGQDVDGGPKVDKEKALGYLERAVKLGEWSFEAQIAELFLRAEQPRAAEVHWNTFFLNASKAMLKMEELPSHLKMSYHESLSKIGVHGWVYCEAVAAGKINDVVENRDVLFAEGYIRSYIDEYFISISKNPDGSFVKFMTERLNNALRYLNFISRIAEPLI